MQKVKFAVKEYIKKIWRFPFICVMKHRLKNHRFSLISANCIGGVLTHDVGEQFRSPTINLIIPEFIKFAENLKFYLSQAPAIAGTTPEGYPIITCGGG